MSTLKTVVIVARYTGQRKPGQKCFALNVVLNGEPAKVFVGNSLGRFYKGKEYLMYVAIRGTGQGEIHGNILKHKPLNADQWDGKGKE